MGLIASLVYLSGISIHFLFATKRSYHVLRLALVLFRFDSAIRFMYNVVCSLTFALARLFGTRPLIIISCIY